MSATAARPRKKREAPQPTMSRDQAADRLLPLLGDEPQSEAALARALGLTSRRQSTVTHDGLAVLESRHQAKKVPYNGRTGWVSVTSDLEPDLPQPHALAFPKVKLIRCDEIFVPDYQRPLTSYYNEIKRDFSIYLFGNIVLSDRGANRNGSKRYAAVDGQTRWKAASDLGIIEVPGIIHTGLSPQEEARMFVDIQRKRKNVTSYFAFRAELYAEEMEVAAGEEPHGDALAIAKLVGETGFKIGDGPDQIKSVAALRSCYRRDAYLLERTLVNLKAAWPDSVPDSAFIRGLHYLFMHYPIGERRTKDVIEDTRLVRKLQVAGVRKVRQKADAAREMGTKTNEKAFAMGIQSVYLGS